MNYKNIINMYKPQAKLTIPYRGEGLINLANYYTYKYNNSCDEFDGIQSNHHLSGLRFSHRGLACGKPHSYYTNPFKILFIIFIFINPLFGVILVEDATNNLRSIAEFGEQVKQWQEEAKRWAESKNYYTQTLDAQKAELQSKTGIRGSISFMRSLDEFYNNSKYSTSYYRDFYNNPSNISPRDSELLSKLQLFDRCNHAWYSYEEKIICQSELITSINELEEYNRSMQDFEKVNNNIKRLQKQLTTSSDIKESADISNALQTSIAQAQIIKTRLDLINSHSQTQRRIRAEQKEQLINKQMQVNPSEELLRVDREKGEEIRKQVEENERRAKEISEQRRKERKARGEPDRLFN